jgi:hypothetical protein
MNEGYHITCKEPVPSLEWDVWGACIGEAYLVAPRKEVNLQGLVTNSLLAERGSVQVCNRAITIEEMRAALGRKC